MVRMRGRFTLALLLFGVACAGSGEPVDPMTAYERAGEPDRRAIERVRYAQTAIDSGQLTKDQLADAYYWQGESYYYLKSYDDAQRAYEQVLRINPDDGITFGAIGHIAYVRGDWDEAIRLYRDAYELTRDRHWTDAVEKTRRARAEEREAATRPPPVERGRETREVELIYIGFRAEKIQKDGAFKKTNEIQVAVDASTPGQISSYGFHDDRNGVKKGTRVVVNKLAWRGPIDSKVAIKLEVNELEPYEGPSLGRRFDRIGKTTIHSVPRDHLSRDWLSEHGFHYHLRSTLTGSGARIHVYFQYRLAR